MLAVDGFLRHLISVALISSLSAGCAGQIGTIGNPSPEYSHFKDVPSGIISTPGVVIEEPNQFRFVSGQQFAPPFQVNCSALQNYTSESYNDALRIGAHKVNLTVGNRKYFAVLLFCKVHDTAAGPASRSHDIRFSENLLNNARGGLISFIGEPVAVVRRPGPETPDILKSLIGHQTRPPDAQQIDDFGWVIWFSDKPFA